ncbi:hypothetical protein D3C76_1609920 [compost metagenome]
MFDLIVKQIACWDITQQHFFQAHRLCGQLQDIFIVNLGLAPFVFNREGNVLALSTINRHTLVILHKLYYITYTGYIQFPRSYRHSTDNELVSPLLPCKGLIRISM